MLSPFEWKSLYRATTLGFSLLQGLHHEAQKSTIVTFPKLFLSEITFPSGFGAEKLGALHLAAGAAGVAGAAGAPGTDDLIALIFSAISLPGLVPFNSSSKLL